MYHSDERINEIAASLDSIKECAETYFHTKKGMIPSRADTVAIDANHAARRRHSDGTSVAYVPLLL